MESKNLGIVMLPVGCGAHRGQPGLEVMPTAEILPESSRHRDPRGPPVTPSGHKPCSQPVSGCDCTSMITPLNRRAAGVPVTGPRGV